MNRRIIAFVVAPLLVPILLAHYLYTLAANETWFMVALMFSVAIAHGGTFILGVPIYLLMRARNWTSFWIAPLLGFFAAGFMWLGFAALLALLLDQGMSGVRVVLTNPHGLSDVMWPFGPLGAIVGMAFWLIARPDK